MLMKNRSFDKIVSFMQGASWGLVILGAYLFFTLFYPFGFIVSLIGGFFGASIGFFMVIFFEMAHIKQEMYKEKIKHTEILEKILMQIKKDEKLSDN
jgi:hypothetical protein